MSRDKNGRFTDCGNPKGRPRAFKYISTPGIAHSVPRNDFFEVDSAAITISENGKRKQISRPRFGGLNHACLGVRNFELQVRDRPDSGHAEICQKRRE
jgi:hypothetical protein